MLGEHLDKFIIAYLDNIIVYSNNREEHKKLFKKVKNKFIKELVLKIYKLELPIKVKTDLLDFILRAQLL